MTGRIVKQGLKRVLAASPLFGLAVVSAVITKYIVEDIRERRGIKPAPEAPEQAEGAPETDAEQ
ncbi:MAG: hypothetical protein IJ600_06645 [Lachnospiraceae bacterium]|nr:hypothetical protein [Lachnospiraceae bacterium]